MNAFIVTLKENRKERKWGEHCRRNRDWPIKCRLHLAVLEKSKIDANLVCLQSTADIECDTKQWYAPTSRLSVTVTSQNGGLVLLLLMMMPMLMMMVVVV